MNRRLAVSVSQCAALACLVSSGCHLGTYSAGSLPTELAAHPSINPAAMVLPSMGASSVRNESIYLGDTLTVTIVTGIEPQQPPSWNVRVADDGTVDVPLVGPVRVAGLDISNAESVVRQACIERQVYRNPRISLAVKQRRVHRVTVSGAVADPGTHELPAASSDLVNALLAAGGLREDADVLVEIHDPTRGNDPGRSPGNRLQSMQIDLVSATATGRGNVYLEDGATVNVNEQPPRYIHVIGLASSNKSVKLPPNRDVRLLDALADAGGLRYSHWISDRIHIIRQIPNSSDTVTIKLSLRKAKRDGRENILLAPGDVVSVEENVVTFTLSTLQGLVGIGAQAATGAAVAVP